MNIYDVKILKLFQSSFEVIFRAKRGADNFSYKKEDSFYYVGSGPAIGKRCFPASRPYSLPYDKI